MARRGDFSAKIDDSGDGCWPWTACRFKDGYGQVRWHGRRERAHRVAWMLAFGEIPAGARVLHTCDNPPCCRPDHLFLGTQSDNMQDMVSKGRNFNPATERPESLARGEHARSAKLTAEAAREIRRQRALGASYTELGRMFGVNKKTAWDAVNLTWAHV